MGIVDAGIAIDDQRGDGGNRHQTAFGGGAAITGGPGLKDGSQSGMHGGSPEALLNVVWTPAVGHLRIVELSGLDDRGPHW
ncbi:hypothetical protein GCM10011505_08900 [Tistrella bauzanensis]|uniref:Uncharacterized protein n=1 Tax=Tistrella bauzanensis TaxID=657419 RepID=A0ABQ1I9S9_9PROT|nr:hypothetical protein GCM10011505_08900 [Tistrella bauzanensis]